MATGRAKAFIKPTVMKSLARLFLVLGLAARLVAHECWLQPSTFSPAAGGKVRLTIQVGMEFTGETRPFNPQRVAALKHFSAAGAEDWTALVTPGLEFAAPLPVAGTHVITYDSKPSFIELDAEKFHEYLREEGLEHVIAEREKAGEGAKPGRERYQRCIKSILQAGGKADGSYAVVTGQHLELIPLDDPAATRPGGAIRFQLLFAGQPLAGSKVRAWQRQGGKLTTLDAISSASGEVTFQLPLTGEWMISTVHMARATGDAEADWKSHWGNLTFAVPAR
jgi:uncharacterized GH25 family protein